jgi:hypothetical protein
MLSAPPDRLLRRAVVQLQGLPREDFDAVLETLDPPQRTRVLTLLGDLQGLTACDDFTEASQPFDAVVLPPDISGWLVARINGSGHGGDETADQFVMTDHAHKALRRCAADFVPQPGRVSPKPSLASRLVSFFA